MMDNMQIFSQNMPFLTQAYGMNMFVSGFLFIVFVDLALKGWGMWRAARMEKKAWFIALLLINSMGIFPAIFLLLTNGQYKEFLKKKGS